MTQQDRSTDSAGSPDPLAALVLRCQETYTNWAIAGESERETLGLAYRLLLEELWSLLANDLRHITRIWTHHTMAPDAEALALGMFNTVAVSLPKLQIDPLRTMRNQLLAIAQHGLSGDYRRNHPNEQQQSNQSAIDDQSKPVDPQYNPIEGRTVRRLNDEALLKSVWHYWLEHLVAIEYEMMKLRWDSDPPRPFSDIAAQLGPEWDEAAVYQCHQRIMEETRTYLRANGLIDENADL